VVDKDAQPGLDDYPAIERADMKWLIAELERRAPGGASDIANVARVKAGLKLEIIFVVLPPSRAAFTADVCVELAQQMAERVGVPAAIVYVARDPHPAAIEALGHVGRGGV